MRETISHHFWPWRTALVLAHPGHELCLWRWIELVRPRVLIVTDGSGRNGSSRIARSNELLANCGAQIGTRNGSISDRQLYRTVLGMSLDYFRKLTDYITQELVQHRTECVVGDSAEGQIMAHDLIRELRRAAVVQAEAILGRSIEQFEFPLNSHPLSHPTSVVQQVRRIMLNECDLARKTAIARAYVQVKNHVNSALQKYGECAYAVECLFPCVPESLITVNAAGLRAYEIHGQRLTDAGEYPQAINYQEHLLPIIQGLCTVGAKNVA